MSEGCFHCEVFTLPGAQNKGGFLRVCVNECVCKATGSTLGLGENLRP